SYNFPHQHLDVCLVFVHAIPERPCRWCRGGSNCFQNGTIHELEQVFDPEQLAVLFAVHTFEMPRRCCSSTFAHGSLCKLELVHLPHVTELFDSALSYEPEHLYVPLLSDAKCAILCLHII